MKTQFKPAIIALATFFIVGLLAGCGGAATTPESSPTATVETATTAESTSVSEEAATPTTQAEEAKATVDVTKGDLVRGCTAVEFPENTKVPPVSAKDWVEGSDNAEITVVEYSDFQCPFCSKAAPILEELRAKYGDKMRFVYRHFPLIGTHDKAQVAAEAAEAAGAQGKFWEMHDILFAKQDEWSKKLPVEVVPVFVDYAKEAGVPDLKKFQADLDEGTYKEQMAAAYKTARDAGLGGTPSLIINQVDYPTDALGLTPEGFDLFISLVKLRQTQWYSKPEVVIDPNKNYQATIETEKGDVVIDLYADTAPVNVNSFAFLAQNDWYKGVTFHRVITDFMAQGGDPTGSGVGFPGYRCNDEVVATHKFDGAGVVALANSGPNTNGGQFFITYSAQPTLDSGFTIIGQVVAGQEVVDKLTRRDPDKGKDLPKGDEIINITVKEKK